MDNNISFSKIVATPTLNSWSQAYNAGKLFAVLSLEKTAELPQDIESLNILGKDLLERLEQEFFTIEDKNLESIKNAIANTFQNQIENVNYSFAAGAFVGNILYLFALGNGKGFIKRDGNLGVALDSQNLGSKDVASSSGFLKEADLIVLATDAFSKTITNDDLNFNLNDTLTQEIAESLAPRIHKASDGRISAIVIKYANPLMTEEAKVTDETLETEEEIIDEAVVAQASTHPLKEFVFLIKARFKKPNISFQPTKKIFLIAAIIIVGILISSIFFTIQSQNNAKMRALFAQVYSDAQKEYDEGQSLADLNKNLARDSFLSAQKILNDNKDKFPEKSKELAQIQDLSKKIEAGLAQFSPVDSSGLDRSKLSVVVQNGSGIEGVAGKAANILKELGYNIASTGNADNYDYQGVTIKVKKEKGNFLDLLKKDLSKVYTVSVSSSDLASDSPTAAVVIIGK